MAVGVQIIAPALYPKLISVKRRDDGKGANHQNRLRHATFIRLQGRRIANCPDGYVGLVHLSIIQEPVSTTHQVNSQIRSATVPASAKSTIAAHDRACR